jgi:predicted nucleic acid-binding protein
VTDTVFLDADVLIAAHDRDAGEKRAIADQVLRQLWQDQSGVLSVQVLQEFYVALVGAPTSPVPRRAARELVDSYSTWRVAPIDAADLLAAAELEERHRIRFRDALIVTAARKSRATLILSERIVPARQITGLEVRNPFA